MITENGVVTKASSSLWSSGWGLCSGVNTFLGLVTSVPFIASALPIVWMSGLRRLLKGRVFFHSYLFIHSLSYLFMCVCGVLWVHTCRGSQEEVRRQVAEVSSSALWVLGIKLHQSGLAASICIY